MPSRRRLPLLAVALVLACAESCQHVKIVTSGADGSPPEFWVDGQRVLLPAAGATSVSVVTIDAVTHEATATRHSFGTTLSLGAPCGGSSFCRHLEGLPRGAAVLIELPPAALGQPISAEAVEALRGVGAPTLPGHRDDSGGFAFIGRKGNGAEASARSPSRSSSAGLRSVVEGEVFCKEFEDAVVASDTASLQRSRLDRLAAATEKVKAAAAFLVGGRRLLGDREDDKEGAQKEAGPSTNTTRTAPIQDGLMVPYWIFEVLQILIFIVIVLILLVGCCYLKAVMKTEAALSARYSPKSRSGSSSSQLQLTEGNEQQSLLRATEESKALEVFRLNATKDRYDYFEEMEHEDHHFKESVIPWAPEERFKGRRVVVVLEKCNLEFAETLPDKSSPIHNQENDLLIVHECLISLLDSPLNKAGNLLVFLHSEGDKLFEVHPSLRVPRNFRIFAELIYIALKTGKVKGVSADFSLMQVLQGPVDQWLPPGAQTFALSQSGTATRLRDVAESTAAKTTKSGSAVAVFAIAASRSDAVTEANFGRSYCSQTLSVCPHGLRSQYVCQMVCSEYFALWSPKESKK